MLVLLALAAEAAAAAPPPTIAREWLMGTLAEVRVHETEPDVDAAAAIEAAFAEMRLIDRLMAVQRPDSDLSRLNRDGARGPVRVDPRLIEVLEASADFVRVSDGAFDPTVLPVVRAWGFTDGRPRVPGGEPRRIAGFASVIVDAARDSVRFSSPATAVDLAGIAKGYALDRARAILRARGVRAAWLDLGGEIATLGAAPGGGSWRVGIRHPRRPGTLLGVVELGEAAVATSGDGEQYVEEAGRRRGHVIDPRSARPADGLASATVIARSATAADALSTAAVVLGAARALRLMAASASEGVFARAAEDGCLALAVSDGARFEPAPTASDRQCEGGER